MVGDNVGPQQSPVTCQKLERFISQRNRERTGDCKVNKECTKIHCFLSTDIPEPNNATQNIIFYPCSKPIHVYVLFVSTLKEEPIISINLTESRIINHKHAGKFNFKLTQLEGGIRFGVCCLLIGYIVTA